MDTKILEEIGLTPGEAKVYLALLKIGQSSTGAITKESQVSRSKLYIILDKLTKKGLVGSLIRGKVAYFSAMEPKRIINYLEEKTKHFNQQKEIIQKILPELKQRARKQQTEAILYLGFKAIKNFYLNILDELSPRSTYYVIGATYGENKPGVKEFFENYHKQRAKKKIKVKMLANYDIKSKLVKTTSLKSEIKFLPEYLVSNMTIVFYKNKSFIFFLSEEPVGFLVENEEIAKGFKSYFDAFWRIAKK
ncbi:hypothetical protein J4422_02780 [Candidatus Pacearchaeota archaeon]|nr:hypothetical protein [Candidatus Pacearchaeota archaeon]